MAGRTEGERRRRAAMAEEVEGGCSSKASATRALQEAMVAARRAIWVPWSRLLMAWAATAAAAAVAAAVGMGSERGEEAMSLAGRNSESRAAAA